MPKTPELDKQLSFIKDGTTQTLTEFYDWMMSRGYRFVRWEEVKEERTCPAQLCKYGLVTVPNPDPRAGWASDVPETLEEPCDRCGGTGYLVKVLKEDWVMFHADPEQLFADFLGINRDKIEAERRALLRELQDSHHD
jgi:hypothetical protein